MLKQITIAECDRCGKIEPAKAVSGRCNYVEYTLPDEWRKGYNNSFLLCPDCALARELETTLTLFKNSPACLWKFTLKGNDNYGRIYQRHMETQP